MKRSNLLLTTAIATLLAAPVPAQETGTGGSEANTAASASGIGSYSVGELLGLPVVSDDGVAMGQVETVIEGDEGALALVPLEDRTVALPLAAFREAEDGQTLAVDRTRREIEQMAGYQDDGEMTLDTDRQVADILEQSPSGSDTNMASGDGMAEGQTSDTGSEAQMAEGAQPAAGPGSDAPTAETESSDMASGTAPAEGQDPGTGTQDGLAQFADMTVGDLLGMSVVGADGEVLGEIDYIYPSAADGYLAAIGMGGFLGIGEDFVALPLGDFSVDAEGDTLLLDHTEEELEAMQKVDDDELQTLPDDHVIDA